MIFLHFLARTIAHSYLNIKLPKMHWTVEESLNGILEFLISKRNPLWHRLNESSTRGVPNNAAGALPPTLVLYKFYIRMEARVFLFRTFLGQLLFLNQINNLDFITPKKF